jgi:hypothetical protein
MPWELAPPRINEHDIDQIVKAGKSIAKVDKSSN